MNAAPEFQGKNNVGRGQFTVRTLFIVTAIVAVIMSVFATARVLEQRGERRRINAEQLFEEYGVVWNEIFEMGYAPDSWALYLENQERFNGEDLAKLKDTGRNIGLVSLVGTPVTDDDLVHLLDHRHLEFVDLRDTMVTEEGVREFRRASRCKVTWFAEPTHARGVGGRADNK